MESGDNVYNGNQTLDFLTRTRISNRLAPVRCVSWHRIPFLGCQLQKSLYVHNILRKAATNAPWNSKHFLACRLRNTASISWGTFFLFLSPISKLISVQNLIYIVHMPSMKTKNDFSSSAGRASQFPLFFFSFISGC